MTKILATAAMLTGALAIPAFAAEPTPAEEAEAKKHGL
jgi:hypothetical protein